MALRTRRPDLADLQAVRDRLLSAGDRDRIVETILQFARARFAYAAAFAVVHGRIQGHDALGQDPIADREAIRKVRLSPAWQTVLGGVLEAGGHHLGPPPEGELNDRLLTDLGRGRPAGVLAVPVYVRSRPVLILYADNGPKRLRQDRVSELLILASALPSAFEALIRRRKADWSLEIPERAARAPEQAAPVPEQAAPVPEQAAPVPEQAAPAPEQAAPVPEQAAPVPEQAASVPEQAARAPEQAAPAPEQAAPVPEQAAPAPEQAAPAPEQAAPAPEQAAPAPPEDLSFADLFVDEPAPARSRPVPTPAPRQPEAQPSAPGRAAGWSAWEPIVADSLEEALAAAVAARPEPDPDEPAPPLAGSASPQSRPSEAATPDQAPADAPDGLPAGDRAQAEVERLLHQSDATDVILRLSALGPAAAEALAQRFPGPLLRPVVNLAEMPRDPLALGPVIGAMARLGRIALPALYALATDPDVERRLYALILLSHVPDPEALPILGRSISDPDPRVATAARDTLGAHRSVPGYAGALAALRTELAPSTERGRLFDVIRTFSHLRDRHAVGPLVDLLESGGRDIADEVLHALVQITKQSFGTAARRWRRWHEAFGDAPRHLWLIEGLKHRAREVRLSAAQELEWLTGETFGFYYDAPAAERASAVRRWESWWEAQSVGA